MASPARGGDDGAARGIARAFLAIAPQAEPLAWRGRHLSVDCLVGDFEHPVHLRIVGGHVVEGVAGPVLMRPWRFAYRATPEAWTEFWRPVPRPGWHDLLSLTKLGVATLEGDLHPFLANLQFFKDLLALPRGRSTGGDA